MRCKATATPRESMEERLPPHEPLPPGRRLGKQGKTEEPPPQLPPLRRKLVPRRRRSAAGRAGLAVARLTSPRPDLLPTPRLGHRRSRSHDHSRGWIDISTVHQMAAEGRRREARARIGRWHVTRRWTRSRSRGGGPRGRRRPGGAPPRLRTVGNETSHGRCGQAAIRRTDGGPTVRGPILTVCRRKYSRPASSVPGDEASAPAIIPPP